jgi:hypothetical protein
VVRRNTGPRSCQYTASANRSAGSPRRPVEPVVLAHRLDRPLGRPPAPTQPPPAAQAAGAGPRGTAVQVPGPAAVRPAVRRLRRGRVGVARRGPPSTQRGVARTTRGTAWSSARRTTGRSTAGCSRSCRGRCGWPSKRAGPTPNGSGLRAPGSST